MRRRLRLQVLVVGGGEARLLLLLLAVGPHHPRPGQVLLHQGADLRELVLHALEAVVDLAAEVADQDRHEQQGQQREQQQRARRCGP